MSAKIIFLVTRLKAGCGTRRGETKNKIGGRSATEIHQNEGSISGANIIIIILVVLSDVPILSLMS
jgi:hypothetical protein